MASIKDWLGRAINMLSLTMPVATADAGSQRPWISGTPADGLMPQRLARILRSADLGDPLAYFELAEDIEERDAHYLSVLATRRRSVAQLPITVKAGSDDAAHKKHAEFVQSWIDDGILRASLFDMLDAIGKGLSVMEVDWAYQGGMALPQELIYRTPRWFTFDRNDGETVLLREGVGGVPLPPHKFIVHRHKSKSGLTIRSGIARVALWAWMFKSFTQKDWAIFCQNFGQPIRIGRYGRGASEEEKEVLRRAVFGIAGDCAAILPERMGIELVEVSSKGSSTDLFERRADWYDRQTSKIVLGQTTTTDAVSGGHAVSREHRLVQEDIERDDAGVLTTTINKQLIRNIVAFNFGPQKRYPHVRIGRPDEVPLLDFAKAFALMAPQGLTAEESFIRDRMGIPTPGENAVLVGGRKTGGGAAADPASADNAPTDATNATALNMTFDNLFKSAHSVQKKDTAEILADRLEKDAASALDGMIDEVRLALMHATDLRDAAERLARLELAPDALAEAMARGMALAHLAGQAALIDDIKRAR